MYSSDVTWHQPREPLISPARTVGSKVPQSPSGADAPYYIHIQPTPAATTAPAAAPVPASDNAAPAPPRNPAPAAAPVPASDNAAPAPPRNPTASIRDRVVRELGHEGDVRMPGRTRGETRAMRESPHSMGLMSHAALAQGIATREAFDEAFREHELPPPDADLPTAPPMTCRPRLPLQRRNHRSTLRYGVTLGQGSSTVCCRPTRSVPHSNQSAMSLTPSGCSARSQMSLVG